MKVLLQRVKSASCKVEGELISKIGPGLLLYLGVGVNDGTDEIDYLVPRIVGFRTFPDEAGKMNLSLQDVGGDVLIISQFTLYAETQKGRRPSFTHAATPELAEDLYNKFLEKMTSEVSQGKVLGGVFGGMMEIEAINDGPINFLFTR